jgi:arabinan endo-1,5-alpha-L-arabinosidase
LEPTYGVGVAVADTPLGPWTGLGDSSIMATVPGHVIGPGHNSVVPGPHGQDVIVYHAWDVARTARRMCIDPLRWTDDGPVVDAPTWTEVDLQRDVAARQG